VDSRNDKAYRVAQSLIDLVALVPVQAVDPQMFGPLLADIQAEVGGGDATPVLDGGVVLATELIDMLCTPQWRAGLQDAPSREAVIEELRRRFAGVD
jgi:hypothetical protein